MSSSDVKSMGRSLRHVTDPAARRIIETILQNIDVLKSSVETLENPSDPNWLDLELQNNWVQTSSLDAVLPKYFKNKFNQVFIRGVVSSGTTANGTIIFKLPVGYRSSKVEVIGILEDTGSGDAHFHIHPDGNVTIERVTGSSELSINCSFFAEN